MLGGVVGGGGLVEGAAVVEGAGGVGEDLGGVEEGEQLGRGESSQRMNLRLELLIVEDSEAVAFEVVGHHTLVEQVAVGGDFLGDGLLEGFALGRRAGGHGERVFFRLGKAVSCR